MKKFTDDHVAFFGGDKQLSIVDRNLNVNDGAMEEMQLVVDIGSLEGIALEKLRPSYEIQDTIGATQKQNVNVATEPNRSNGKFDFGEFLTLIFGVDGTFGNNFDSVVRSDDCQSVFVIV